MTASVLTVWSLQDFGAFLKDEGNSLKNAELKQIPFFSVHPLTGQSITLRADSPAEVAQCLAMAASLAYLDKRKVELEEAVAQVLGLAALSKDKAERQRQMDRLWTDPAAVQALAARVSELEQTWLLQSAVRKTDGSLDLDAEARLPRIQVSALKLGELLGRACFAEMLAGVALGAEDALKATTEALASRATHLVKLSVDSGSSRADVKGGYFKKTRTSADSLFLGSVSEQDYLSPVEPALTCNAAYQSKDWLALTQIQHHGQTYRLADLLRSNESLRNDVEAVLSNWPGVQGHVELLQTLASFKDGDFSGEPQLFCGDKADTGVVAPLMPLALLQELLRAKGSLRDAHELAHAQAQDELQSVVAAAQQRLQALKDVGAKGYAEGKVAYAVELAAAKATLDEAKEASKRVGSPYLSVPSFTLLIGGATPRNLASGLTTAVHNASIFTEVREKSRRAAVSAKVFYPASLLATPSIGLTKLPAALGANPAGAAARRSRATLFSAWALQALEPLLALREAWELGHVDRPEALEYDALQVLVERTDAKALFVKGSDVSGKAAQELFLPLIREVSSRIKDGLQEAFKKESFGAFDDEILDVVTSVVLVERA